MVGGSSSAEVRVASPAAEPAEGFRSVATILRSRALDDGSKLAYTFLNDELEPEALLSYGELDLKARAIARALEQRGARGERTLLLFPPGLDFVTAFFGCLYAGVIAVPAYPPKPRRVDPRAREIVLDSGARFSLTTENVLERLGGAEEARRAAGSEQLEWIATDVIQPEAAEESDEIEAAGRDIAYLQYTSGSTSAPKGVVVSHFNLWHNLTAIDREAVRRVSSEEAVAVTWLPHFHDMGLVFGLLVPLFGGFPCHVMPPASFLQHPERWLRALTRYRGTHSAAPNFAYDLCVRKVTPEKRGDLDLASWAVAVNGAEPLRIGTVERFAEAFAPHGFRRHALSPAYGLAEATLMVSSVPGNQRMRSAWFASLALANGSAAPVDAGALGGAELVSCGVPSWGMEVAIVDPENERRAAPGAIGEIWVRGASVGRGYWNRPEDTREVFDGVICDEGEAGFLRTGDLGFLHEGELFVTGRVKDIIIIRGRNHYPHDIEATVETSHSWLRPGSGAAFSAEVDGEERLVVVQEVERQHRRADMTEPLREIRRAVTEVHEIAPYAVLILPIGSVPKTSSGKVRRQACRELWLQGELEPLGEWREAAVEPSAPVIPRRHGQERPSQAEIEAFMIERLRASAKLGSDRVDVSEPFANYGLDSADALELMADLEEYTGVEIAPMLFWNYPTIEALAGHLASGEGETPDR